MRLVGVLVAVILLYQVAITLIPIWTKEALPGSAKNGLSYCSMSAYVFLSGLYVAIGSQIYSCARLLPVHNEALAEQARLVFRVSHLAGIGLLLRSVMIAVQFIPPWQPAMNLPWFSLTFYFLFDFCVVTAVLPNLVT